MRRQAVETFITLAAAVQVRLPDSSLPYLLCALHAVHAMALFIHA